MNPTELIQDLQSSLDTMNRHLENIAQTNEQILEKLTKQ